MGERGGRRKNPCVITNDPREKIVLVPSNQKKFGKSFWTKTWIIVISEGSFYGGTLFDNNCTNTEASVHLSVIKSSYSPWLSSHTILSCGMCSVCMCAQQSNVQI